MQILGLKAFTNLSNSLAPLKFHESEGLKDSTNRMADDRRASTFSNGR